MFSKHATLPKSQLFTNLEALGTLTSGVFTELDCVGMIEAVGHWWLVQPPAPLPSLAVGWVSPKVLALLLPGNLGNQPLSLDAVQKSPH